MSLGPVCDCMIKGKDRCEIHGALFHMTRTPETAPAAQDRDVVERMRDAYRDSGPSSLKPSFHGMAAALAEARRGMVSLEQVREALQEILGPMTIVDQRHDNSSMWTRYPSPGMVEKILTRLAPKQEPKP